MPASKVASLDFLTPPADPASGECEIRVHLEDGRTSSFLAATFDRPAAWLKSSKTGAYWSAPVLFVARLDPASVRAAVDAMAADMGGYWLRYYNTPRAS
jgi:hypothetical protein